MNTLLIKTALSAAIALTIAGCGSSGGGGGGSTAGIGGSGFVSSGSVSGFGSVHVNGVKFETDSATFDVDGNLDLTQDDLAIGMIVNVRGSINDDGETGNATSISFDEELQGPISVVSPPDSVKRSLTILDVIVIIDGSSTTFDVDNSLAGTTFNIGNIAENNVVEVSGFFDSNGNLQATRVELKDLVFDISSIVEVEGLIENFNGTDMFELGGLTVDASTASIDGLSTLVNGQLVEVVGTWDAGSTTIKADRVEGEDNSVADIDEFEIEGIITDYVSDSNFKLGDIFVDASSATFEPFSLSLKNDMRIEAEGNVFNGVLTATEIEIEGGDLKVHAKVTAVNVVANTFEVVPNLLTGQTITVTVANGTQLEDDVNGIEPFTLNDLVVGTDFVDIRGFDDGSSGILATEISVKVESDVLVQGVIQSGASAGTVKVLGIEFIIDDLGQTGFDDISDGNISQAEFFSVVTFDTTLIKVQDDKAADGIANEIDIESSP